MYGYAGFPFTSDLATEAPASQGEFQGVIKTPFGEAREVPLHRFFDSLSPHLRHGLDPAQVLEAIKSSKVLSSCLTRQGRWRGFAKDPALCDRSVYQTFSHLEGVVRAVVGAASSVSGHLKPRLNFENNPSPTTTIQQRFDTKLPDAFFLEDDECATWKNIAVCGEYQKENTSDCVEQNIAKVTGSMASCIRQDPRRRFVFGYTIENIDMRLWYCDRGSIVASQSFNFITDHLSLVHFLLSVLYAKSHQLGWDNTMTRLPDGLNFDITIHSHGQDRTYRTQKLLFDRGSRILLGKATRVWQAVLLEDGDATGPPVALKDCWVEYERTREGDILRRIQHDILTGSPDDEDLVVRLFPSAEWDGDVYIGDGETALDLTRAIPEIPDSGSATTEGDDTKASRESRASSKKNLVHYRLVLSPASETSIEHETSPWKIFQTLAHAAGALQLMHKAGWVHRDVSSGNIALGGRRARLIDFEFAKRASEEDDLTIGTTFFKAFELVKEAYAFRPPPPDTPLPEPPVPDKLQSANLAQTTDLPDGSTRTTPEHILSDAEQKTEPAIDFSLIIPMRYNPLHDLESLWWVALYFILKREPLYDAETSEVDRSGEWNREQQRAYADKAFNLRDTRHSIMVQSIFYRDAVQVIHPTMMPALRILANLQRSLVERYSEVEKTPRSITFSCAEGLHEIFGSRFLDIAELPQFNGVSLRPLAPPPPLRGVVPAALEVLERQPEEKKEEIPVQAAKEEIRKDRKGGKTRRRRKPTSNAASVQHGYNLRPRPNRD